MSEESQVGRRAQYITIQCTAKKHYFCLSTSPRSVVFVTCRVVPVRYRPLNDFGASPGALWCDFAHWRDGVAPHRRAAPYASPVDDHVGLSAGRAHAHSEAAHGIIPYCELSPVGFKGVHHTLGDPLGCHGSLAAVRSGATPGQHQKGIARNLQLAAYERESPQQSGFYRFRESLGIVAFPLDPLPPLTRSSKKLGWGGGAWFRQMGLFHLP